MKISCTMFQSPFKAALLLLLFNLPLISMAQTSSKEYKLHYDNAPLYITDRGDTSRIGFVGGLYSAQFNNLDLNLDGVPDLVVFDAEDFELLTFLTVSKNGQTYFEYAPDYAELLPAIRNWMYIADFDGDGKLDIFAGNGFGGIKVYKNISTSTQLLFELYSKELSYFDTDLNFNLNIYVSPTDYPGIADVDNDGDLDVLSFDAGGGDVYFYKNLSMEKYNHTDSFIFEVETYCFGMFREDANSNGIKHLPCCYIDGNCKRGKHAGASILVLDIDDDGDKDMVLADVGYKTVNLLVNGKNPNSANPYPKDSMVSIVTEWPKNTKKVEVDNFPGLTMADVNFDGLPDLLVSPKDFEQNMITPNTWFYKNVGTVNKPVFEYVRTGFVDGDGIDIGTHSNPFLFDYDGDGDLDLFVCGPKPYRDYLYDEAYYQISYYENVGTSTKAIYELKTEDWMGFSTLEQKSLMLAFGDVDNNGTQDMLVGLSSGHLMLYINSQNPDKQASFSLSSDKYQNINAGGYAAPFLYDMTGNGLNDLFIGNQAGYVQYWENDKGTFTKKNDSLGSVYVGNVLPPGIRFDGYAVPVVVNLDDDKRPELLVSSIRGEIFIYTNIQLNQTTFNRDSKPFLNKVANRFENRVLGDFLSLAVGDVNGDDIPDVMLGNKRGGIYFFNGSLDLKLEQELQVQQPKFTIYPNPSNGQITFHLPEYEQDYRAEWYNMQGKKIQEFNQISHLQQFNVSDIPTGLYVVKVYKNGIILGTQKLHLQTTFGR